MSYLNEFGGALNSFVVGIMNSCGHQRIKRIVVAESLGLSLGIVAGETIKVATPCGVVAVTSEKDEPTTHLELRKLALTYTNWCDDVRPEYGTTERLAAALTKLLAKVDRLDKVNAELSRTLRFYQLQKDRDS